MSASEGNGFSGINSGISEFTTSIVIGVPGDANGDQAVTFEDFLILSANFGQSETDVMTGDFTGDNKTTFADFLVLSRHFGKSLGVD